MAGLQQGRLVQDAPKMQVGLAVFYVDDILIAAEPEARDGFLRTLQETWKCSPPEHVSSQSWTRFCGFELKYNEEETELKVGLSVIHPRSSQKA